MKYIMLIYQPPGFDPKTLSAEDHSEIAKQYGAVSATPGVQPGLPMGHIKDAVTVRVVEGGETNATDGPYVDAAGAVGGYLVFEAESEQQAVELASKIPAARLGGAVEVRRAEAYW